MAETTKKKKPAEGKSTTERAAELGAKVPDDHKEPAEVSLEDLPGADLLKPPGKLFHGTLARFLGRAMPLVGALEDVSDEDGGLDVTPDNAAEFAQLLDVTGQLLELMRDIVAKDPAAFEDWASGDNLEQSIDLAVRYVVVAGESMA